MFNGRGYIVEKNNASGGRVQDLILCVTKQTQAEEDVWRQRIRFLFISTSILLGIFQPVFVSLSYLSHLLYLPTNLLTPSNHAGRMPFKFGPNWSSYETVVDLIVRTSLRALSFSHKNPWLTSSLIGTDTVLFILCLLEGTIIRVPPTNSLYTFTMSSSYESKPLRDENRNRRDDSRGRQEASSSSSSRGQRRDDSHRGRYYEPHDDVGKEGRHRYEDRGNHSSKGRSRSRDRRGFDDRDRRDYDHYSSNDKIRRGNDYDRRNNHRDRSRGARDRRDSGKYGPDRGSENRSPSNRDSDRTVFRYYKVVKAPADDKLGGIHDDPRGEDPRKRITKKASARGAG